MNQIYDYILDFDVKIVDPVYAVKIYYCGRLVRKLGSYQLHYPDLVKAYLLVMKIENLDPKHGKLILKAMNCVHDFDIEYSGEEFL